MMMLPEIIIIVLAFTVLSLDLFYSGDNKKELLAGMTWLGLAGATATLLTTPQMGQMFSGRFVMDPTSWWIKLTVLLSGFICVGLSYDWISGKNKDQHYNIESPGEFCAILLFTISGMLYMASARDLVSVYVGLELATIPLFLLAAWHKTSEESKEAGAKYLITGAMASAFLLYGFGLLYGLTGETSFDEIKALLGSSPAMYLAVVMIIAGIGFKITMVPFHMWSPDVYQGAPTPITAFLSTGSKAAGVMMLYHILMRLFPNYVGQFGDGIALLAFLTMTLGNLVAIVQTNMKRFLAFSGISQAGYILMGFLGGPARADETVPFYLLVYLVSNLSVFGVALYHSSKTSKENIEDYRGLSKTQPLLALIMLLGLFSLAGIPPLSGFLGKFFLFAVAAEQGYYWLVGAAAVNSTVSLYYYLKIVRQMYIEAPMELPEGYSKMALPIRISLYASIIGTVLLGIIPVS